MSQHACGPTSRDNFDTHMNERAYMYLDRAAELVPAAALPQRGGGGGGGVPMFVPCAKILHTSIIGDQFAHSVADDLNIYYEQFPCVGTPTFQSYIDRISLEKRPMTVGAFYEATVELKGFH